MVDAGDAFINPFIFSTCDRWPQRAAAATKIAEWLRHCVTHHQ